MSREGVISKTAFINYLEEKMEWYRKQPSFFATEMATVEQILEKLRSDIFDLPTATDEEVKEIEKKLLFNEGQYNEGKLLLDDDVRLLLSKYTETLQREAWMKEANKKLEYEIVQTAKDSVSMAKGFGERYEELERCLTETLAQVERLEELADMQNEQIERSKKSRYAAEANLNQAVELLTELRRITPYGTYHEMIDPVLESIKRS